jgi:hypothetical protein
MEREAYSHRERMSASLYPNKLYYLFLFHRPLELILLTYVSYCRVGYLISLIMESSYTLIH